jgi:hypothetical protein
MWLRQADAPAFRRADFAWAECGGRLYLAGGSPNHKSPVVAYDPTANMWIQAAKLPVQIWDHAMTCLEGKVYAAAGRAFVPTGGRNEVLWEYHPAADQWRSRAPHPRLLVPALAGVSGRLFCFGGEESMLTLVYDPSRDDWSAASPLLYPVEKGRYGVIGGKIYAFSADWEFQVLDPADELEWLP